MAKISTAPLAEALTFDDVLLRPGHSTFMPGEVNLGTQLTRGIRLNLPIISSAMDTTKRRTGISSSIPSTTGPRRR